MPEAITYSGIKAAAANQNVKEKEYWLDRLSGDLVRSHFPYEKNPAAEPDDPGESLPGGVVKFEISGRSFGDLERIGNRDDRVLHVVLTAALTVLLFKYSGNEDIIVGTPIYRQEEGQDTEDPAAFVNTVVALRSRVKKETTFKELLLRLRQTVLEAVENQDYPIEVLAEQLHLPDESPGFPLFGTLLLLENIQDPRYVGPLRTEMTFSFRGCGERRCLEGELHYDRRLYDAAAAERIGRHFCRLLEGALSDLDAPVSRLEMLPGGEKRRLVFDFNRTKAAYPLHKTIHRWFQEQAEKTPQHTAVVDIDNVTLLTYRELNRRANRLAGMLRRQGVAAETVVGVMLGPSAHMIAVLLAVLKAGGAYLPIEPDLPRERVLYLLRDAAAGMLVSGEREIENISFTLLEDFERDGDVEIVKTAAREPIRDLDSLPVPDRSLIDLRKYRDRIGMASVTEGISLQATRGCPYRCVFCHKVWSKHHVFRSAENIYEEILYYYRRGVKNFAVIDDVFNLDRPNSERLFRRLIENRLDIQLFFPNGLRGDILTPDYIDLMVEAGTRGINLSLETASPRLQRLIKKNLDIDKFREVIHYIAVRHPGVILEIATMHGFPTETEAEALMTLDFIKEVRWLHFPYIHILKIYPHTEMEELALEQGISREEILASRDRAFHELPETLPFPRSFTRKYQANFMNEYFLCKERLVDVLPVQLKILGEAALVEKYNTYLPVEVHNLQDILDFAQLDAPEPSSLGLSSRPGGSDIAAFEPVPPAGEPAPGAGRILLLDLSGHFSTHSMLYDVTEQPLGLLYLSTYLEQRFGSAVHGRIYKSGVDFDSFQELRELVDSYRPHLVGIRTLTFYREFFHRTVSLLRQWGVEAPIIAGGPYATSDYPTLLRDTQVDAAVLGEGEYSLGELVEKMLERDFEFPPEEVLQDIGGIAFARKGASGYAPRRVWLPDEKTEGEAGEESADPDWSFTQPASGLAYVMYTSGSTGKPKGVMVEHRQVNNCIFWMQDRFRLEAGDVVIQRTNLSFDPSVWEIFWPLYVGAGVRVLDTLQRKDVQFLIRLMTEGGKPSAALMYCPATLVEAMTRVLEERGPGSRLRLPWLITGAEPIARRTVETFYRHFEGRLVNTYGPTECTINNTYCDLEREGGDAVVPIGKPISNNSVFIASRNLQLLPTGTLGEICIAGDSVARGYINRPRLTAGSFVDNPFSEGRLYRTGDVGRWRENGDVEIRGRTDQQVKIRGYRIEPGEIESALSGLEGVRGCVVAVGSDRETDGEIKTCKRCGITSNYPGVNFGTHHVCDICENMGRYRTYIDAYFGTLKDLAKTIREANRGNKAKYHCLLLYGGGRGAAYALYRLKELGFRVLLGTYDHGYLGKSHLANIEKTAAELGVDSVVFTHRDTDRILQESIEAADTVCRGCFHTSASLAGEYAYRNGIQVVIGATLSRGQIIENKLFMFLRQGITGVEELEREIFNVQKNAPDIDRGIFDAVDIPEIGDRTIYEKVKFIDFYRYCDITNREMIDYLNGRSPYWKTRTKRAVYSTNCPIKQIGDFGHLQAKGYHYYGSATSWERRLGHQTLENVKEDLRCGVSAQGYGNFLKRIGMTVKGRDRAERADRAGTETGADERYICAYLAAEDGELDLAGLRESLARKVPAYMIPRYFVQVEEIPLDSNGKVDKKRLPKPDTRMKREEYKQPSNETEARLAAVWQEILGEERIGVEDNFFDLGGDSIKAIQIAARLQKYGLKLEIRDLFLHPTIHRLADCVDKVENAAFQGIVEGEVPLTPIQRWFFQEHPTAPHHHNQSMWLPASAYDPAGFDEDTVRRVFRAIVEHHDALRMVFEIDGAGTRVVQRNRGLTGERELFQLEVFHLEADRDMNPTVKKAADRLQEGMDLAGGPLVRLGLFKTGRGDYLLVAIHHLVVDAVSWRILLEDFALGYGQARGGEEVKFQQKTDSFQYWSRRLEAYALSEEALKELDFWQKIEETEIESLPTDFPLAAGERRVEHNETLCMELDEEQTRRLLKEAHRAYHTEINDILLTALGVSIREWAGLERVAVSLEGHGRESVMQGMDVNRTVGWFTSRFPVIADLGISPGQKGDEAGEIAGWLKGVKETLRAIPGRGFGYGVLRYMTPAEKKKGAPFTLRPEISFNYLGQVAEREVSGVSEMERGEEVARGSESVYKLDINGLVAAGKLVIAVTYNRKEFKKTGVAGFLDCFRAHLEKIIAHCVSREEGELTLSDFDAPDLDQEEVEAIFDELEIEAR